MENEQLYDLLEYAMKQYNINNGGKAFHIIDYYALVDESPLTLARKAQRDRRISLATLLRRYYSDYFFVLRDVPLEKCLTWRYGINDRMLTDEEMTHIYHILENEKYPISYPIFSGACRKYLQSGEEAIYKENIKKHFIDSYNEYSKKGNKVKVKSINL